MEFTAKNAKGAKIFYRSLRPLRPLRFSNCTGGNFVGLGNYLRAD